MFPFAYMLWVKIVIYGANKHCDHTIPPGSLNEVAADLAKATYCLIYIYYDSALERLLECNARLAV